MMLFLARICPSWVVTPRSIPVLVPEVQPPPLRHICLCRSIPRFIRCISAVGGATASHENEADQAGPPQRVGTARRSLTRRGRQPRRKLGSPAESPASLRRTTSFRFQMTFSYHRTFHRSATRSYSLPTSGNCKSHATGRFCHQLLVRNSAACAPIARFVPAAVIPERQGAVL